MPVCHSSCCTNQVDTPNKQIASVRQRTLRVDKARMPRLPFAVERILPRSRGNPSSQCRCRSDRLHTANTRCHEGCEGRIQRDTWCTWSGAIGPGRSRCHNLHTRLFHSAAGRCLRQNVKPSVNVRMHSPIEQSVQRDWPTMSLKKPERHSEHTVAS